MKGPAREPVSGLIVVLLDIILYGFGWLINLLYRLKKGKGMDFFKTYYERIGRQMHLLKNAKSITAREITEKELGADHCSCGNQQVVMDMIDLWIEGLKRRDKSLQRAL